MFEKNLNISLLLDFYGDVLSERQRDILDFYYNDDLSLAEIANNYDISRQGVRSILKKGENILVEMEERLHLAERFTSVQEKSTQIANELKKIISLIDNADISEKISSVINKINELADI